MFDSYYHFQQVGVQKAHNKKYLIAVTIYSFNIENTRYLVEVEEYHLGIHILKFYPKKNKAFARRFNTLTGEFKCSRIVGTCVRIMLAVLKKKPLCSFGFLGSHTINSTKKYMEKKHNTKRFRIYKYAMESLVGTVHFSHSVNEMNSTYLMINNKLKSVSDIKDRADKMFMDLYPQLHLSNNS